MVELAKSILHPEEENIYPEGIRDSAARRAIYDYLKNEARRAIYDYLQYKFELTISVDRAIRATITPDWHTDYRRGQTVRMAI